MIEYNEFITRTVIDYVNLNNIIKNDFAENVTMAHLNSTSQIDLAMTPELQQELQQQQLTADNGGREMSPKGDAMVYGQDLDSITADKGWYRECEHGREVDVGEIYVERVSPEQGKSEKDAKYTMTAVTTMETITAITVVRSTGAPPLFNLYCPYNKI